MAAVCSMCRSHRQIFANFVHAFIIAVIHWQLYPPISGLVVELNKKVFDKQEAPKNIFVFRRMELCLLLAAARGVGGNFSKLGALLLHTGEGGAAAPGLFGVWFGILLDVFILGS